MAPPSNAFHLASLDFAIPAAEELHALTSEQLGVSAEAALLGGPPLLEADAVLNACPMRPLFRRPSTPAVPPGLDRCAAHCCTCSYISLSR
jgi:hypothetical protein